LRLRVRVNTGTVNSKSSVADDKYPQGMKGKEYLELEVDDTKDWSAVYLVLELYQDYTIHKARIEQWDYPQHSTDSQIYHLIAEITVSNDSGYGRYISYIQNTCTPPKDDYSVNDCPFHITDASTGSLQVRVRSNKINDIYPKDMSELTQDSGAFYLTIPTEQPWYAIYLKINKTLDGKIDVENHPNDAMEIVASPYYKTELDYTALMQWELLGEVTTGTDEQNNPYCTYIQNQCSYPTVYATPNECGFKSVDISFKDSNNQLKVWLRTYGKKMLDTNGNDLWPEGMTATTPWIGQEVDTGEPWSIVYLVLYLNYKYEITRSTIEYWNDYQRSTASKIYHPIAEFNIDTDADSGKYISSLTNYCQEPLESYNEETCPFYLQDDSNGAEGAAVRVANTWVYDRKTYPDGMTETTTFSLDVGNSPWYGVYLRATLDADGLPNFKTDTPLVLSVEDTPKTDKNDTLVKKWIFLGEVTVDEDANGHRYCSWIRNNCVDISFPIDTGNVSPCPFGVTLTMEGDNWRVKIAYGKVGKPTTVTPEGMTKDTDYTLTWKDGYVLLGVQFKENSVDIDKAWFEIQTDIPANTTAIAYYPIAELNTYIDADNEPAPNIVNYCYMPEPCVCDLVYKAPSV
jgi:hypothetical protein